MALHELEFFPQKFQEHPGYRDPSLSPPSVANGTASVIDLYFTDDRPNMDWGKEYLTSYTLEYIFGAEKGFLRNFRQIDRTGKITKRDLEIILEHARPYIDNADPEETEAFGHSLVIFSVLPAMATSDYLPMGFSRRGLLTPPFTTLEFLERLNELKKVVMSMVAGKVDIARPIITRPPVLRTCLFFAIARDLPLHSELSGKEKEEQVRYTIEHLLENIKLDL